MLELIVLMFVVLLLLNAWVTWRAVRDDLSSSGQRIAQIGLIWLMPVLGALIVLHLQRQQPDHGSGRYPPEQDAGEDFGFSGKAVRGAGEAIDGDA